MSLGQIAVLLAAAGMGLGLTSAWYISVDPEEPPDSGNNSMIATMSGVFGTMCLVASLVVGFIAAADVG